MKRFAFILCADNPIVDEKSSATKKVLSFKSTGIYSLKNLFLFLLIASALFMTSCQKEVMTESSNTAITTGDVSNVVTTQITDRATFALNQYLYTTSGNPYPLVDNNKLNAIDRSNFKNVMDYGAKGDGKTYDDAAIVQAFKAANSAGTGVIFPSGKTFMVSKISTIKITHDITVWAYGATIKMAPMTRYSFLSIEAQSGSYHYNVIWLGGTLDGNRENQSYPGSPTGNNTWAEAHGRFLGFSYIDFVLVKDINLINIVMDGVGIDASRLGVIADSKASNGAPFKYSEVQEQGTYFKVTRPGFKTCYFINLKCDGGSIGIHASFPTKQTLDPETLVVLRDCYVRNAIQNPIHIEDCYKVFMYRDTVVQNADSRYMVSCHFSNRTGIVSVKNCQFTNGRINLNESSNLKLGILDSNTFVTNYPSQTMMIEGKPTVVAHSSFTGKCKEQQVNGNNILSCTFQDFGAKAIASGYAIDNSVFDNGSKPAELINGGFITPGCEYINVSSPVSKKQPSDNNWRNVFSSYIDVYSDTNKYLGRIQSGTN
jgi:hypothetical protein